MIEGTCAACGRKGHRYGTTHGPNAPDRWDPIACINGLRGEVDQLRGALEGIAARRCLCEGHTGGNHGGPCCGVAGGLCVTCDARAALART